MKEVGSKKINAFVKACHRAAYYGLLRCSSGNMSSRLDDELAMLSASKTWLADLTSEQVAICRIADGTCVNGQTASIESVFHLGILQSRADVNVVLHFQSPYATAIACSSELEKYNFSAIVEVPYYIGEPGIVDYCLPGSTELATAVIDSAKDHDMIILRNHGLVTMGTDYNDAIQKASFFELACQIILCQDNIKFLSPAEIDALRQGPPGV